MPPEPTTKRTIVLFDGQNLFHMAKKAFGDALPNYDPLALAMRVCQDQGWQLKETRFYTGIHHRSENAFWNAYWTAKLGALGRRGVIVFSRPLRYRDKTVQLPGGSTHTFRTAEEKGIDVRIAIDVIRMAHHGEYDVALIFSQDQDISEAAQEVRAISKEQNRWIKIASAFPDSPTLHNRRGINSTDWIRIDQATYDACLDPHNYGQSP